LLEGGQKLLLLLGRDVGASFHVCCCDLASSTLQSTCFDHLRRGCSVSSDSLQRNDFRVDRFLPSASSRLTQGHDITANADTLTAEGLALGAPSVL
jgi:hypothetical protein